MHRLSSDSSRCPSYPTAIPFQDAPGDNTTMRTAETNHIDLHEQADYDAEFARPDLDVYLPGLYRIQSELIVVFLCPEYASKRWCGLEFRHIRQLIGTPDAARIMFLSFEEPGDLSALGILAGDGYIPI